MDENPLRVLVVDDERPIRRLLSASLSGHYKVLEATNGAETLSLAASAHPDGIILDIGLPDMDGIHVTRRLREWTQVPIIIVSVRDGEEDKIAALDAGADDYVSKPFSVGELMARLRAAMRRSIAPESEPIYQSGNLRVDLTMRQVHVNEHPVTLTPTEYEILRILIQHSGKVLTHQQLAQYVWGASTSTDAHLLRVNVSNLRRKIETDPAWPQHILTEAGVGYRLRRLEASKPVTSETHLPGLSS